MVRAADPARTLNDFFGDVYARKQSGTDLHLLEHLLQGKLCTRQGNYEKARYWFSRLRDRKIKSSDTKDYTLYSVAGEIGTRILEGTLQTPHSIVTEAERLFERALCARKQRASFRQNSASTLFAVLAEDMLELDREDLARNMYAIAAELADDLPERAAYVSEAAICAFNAGEYEGARKVFDGFFPLFDPDHRETMFLLMIGGSAEKMGGKKDRSHLAHMLSKLLISMSALYLTQDETREEFSQFFTHFSNVSLREHSTHFADLFYDAFQAIRPLFTAPDGLVRVMPGRTHNSVFTLDDYVYKAGNGMRMDNEEFITKYFYDLQKGDLSTGGFANDRRMSIWDCGSIQVNLPHAGRISIAERIFRLAYNGIPSHIKAVLPHAQAVLCYGQLHGRTAREYILDNPKQQSTVTSLIIEQLALLHAYGPKHLLEKVPFVPRQDARGVLHAHQKRENIFFDEPVWHDLLGHFGPIAHRIDDRKVDGYVKDANPNNWMVTGECDVVSLDYELTMLAGPQYDLVKIIEHFPQTPTTSHKIVRDYIRQYNQSARAFNEQTPDQIHKQIIEDEQEFLDTYEHYVIDFVVKSLQNPNYAHQEFSGQKTQWLNRGVQAINWLQAKPGISQADRQQYDRLRRTFSQSQESTGNAA